MTSDHRLSTARGARNPGSRHLRSASCSVACLALLTLTTGATAADGITLNQDLRQGMLVTGTASHRSVSIDGRKIPVGAEGQVVFGLARDQLDVEICTGAGEHKHCVTHAVESGQWRIERVDGLPPKTVKPDPATAARISRESALVIKARKRNSANTDFSGPWIRPTKGRISGVYGSQRILNGTPGSAHLGLDIAAAKGTPVLATAAGTVSLVHEDMVLSGKTVLLDHGHGVSSVYIHLSEIDVAEGQLLSQGQQIGSVGATGRASGPHLHWGVNWFGVKLDPQSLAVDQ